MRTSALTVINLELEKPHIVHRLSAAYSADPGECGAAAPLTMSTTYRFFKSLTHAGLISTVSPGRYVLGPAIVQLDRQTRLLDPLIRVAQPIMQGVVGDLRLPGVLLLCRLFRKQVMCIHQEFVERPTSAVSYERGRPMPLYRGAASKVILANLPARSVRAFYDANQADMAAAGFGPDWNAVKAALRRLRNARVCVTAGELDAGMTGIGVPLHNAAGAVDASLGFVLPDELSNPQRLELISAALDAAARKFDASLLQAINTPSARSIESRPASSRKHRPVAGPGRVRRSAASRDTAAAIQTR